MDAPHEKRPGDWDAPHWMSPNVEGALWMLASAVCFTAMTTLVKFLGSTYPAPLQTFYRQAASLLVILPLLIRGGPSVFKASRPGILLFRAGAGTLSIMLANYSYQLLPLGLANALSFTRALWLAPLAILILKEKVGVVRVGASVVGFSGVMIILGLDFHQPASFWPAMAGLTSAFLFGFTITGAKIVTRDHAVLTILAWSATLGLVLSIPPALFTWRWPTLPDFFLLALMGAAAMGTQACFVKGMQRGDATATAPVDYVRLVLAIAVGFFLFDEVPSWTSLMGALIVVGAALYIAWYEHRLAVRRPRTADVPSD